MNTITTNARGEVTSMLGERAADALMLAALLESLKLEAKGLQLSAKVTALKIARVKYGDRRMKLADAIERTKRELEQAKSECQYVTETN